jgi:hypothetical protein
MRFRKLRIVWSLFWGIACVLLIVLWVRSHYYLDSYRFWAGRSNTAAIDSKGGRIYFSVSASGGADLEPYIGNKKRSEGETDILNGIIASENHLGFGRYIDLKLVNTSTFIFPHWFAAIVSVTLAAVPWIRWSNRFSLRTLLIATTLVAVVLGWIVYTLR